MAAELANDRKGLLQLRARNGRVISFPSKYQMGSKVAVKFPPIAIVLHNYVGWLPPCATEAGTLRDDLDDDFPQTAGLLSSFYTYIILLHAAD